MEFGADANDDKVLRQMVRCIELFGGRGIGKEMEQAPSLAVAAHRAPKGLRGKSVLLVFDDLWRCPRMIADMFRY